MATTTPSSQAGVKKSKELFLDSQGLCFLCLNQIDGSKPEEICLRNICRYLNIDPCSVLLRGLQESLAHETKNRRPVQDNCDFSVVMCDSCFSVCENMTGLFRQMEIMEMLISHELSVFQQILQASDRKQNLCHIRNNFAEANSVESKLINQLRNDTKTQCNRKLTEIKKASPKVILDRSEVQRFQNNTLSPPQLYTTPIISLDGEDDDNNTEVPTFPNSSINNTTLSRNRNSDPYSCTDDDVQFVSPALAVSMDNNSTNSQSIVSKIFASNCRKLLGQAQFECTICFKTAPYGARVREHLANAHPNTILQNAKLPELTEAAFADCCKHVLNIEVREAAKKSGTTSRNRTVLCSQCGHKCTNTRFLRYHMLTEHYNYLEEKLIDFQKQEMAHNLRKKSQLECHSQASKNGNQMDPKIRPNKYGQSRKSLEGTSSKNLMASPTSISLENENDSLQKFYVCNGCGIKLSSTWGLDKHKRETCPKLTHKKVHWPCSTVTGGCGQKFSTSFCLARHKRYRCPMQKPSQERFRVHERLKKSWMSRTCGQCQGKFGSEKALLVHKKHCSASRENREKLQKPKEPEVIQTDKIPVEILPNNSLQVDAKTDIINDAVVVIEGSSQPEVQRMDMETFESVDCWCGHAFSGRPMIECEQCLIWCHLSCENIAEENIPKNFHCSKCGMN